uniref:lysozyme n=1 Tax=Sitophilus zeamais TaxID=7047 RepID=B6RQP3_SITZE|nr:c-type lysozyme [Sitophilus zeamais]
MNCYVLSHSILLLLLLAVCHGKIYSRCDFAKEMKKSGVKSLAQLGTWTCIAKHESGFNTNAINRKTGDYGILQISEKFWCSNSKKAGKGCNITCKSLLSKGISGDIKCAKHVFAETKNHNPDGFTAWVAYNKCRGNQLSWVKGCGL